MAQVRRQHRNPSPPPRQIPSLPNATRFRSSSLRNGQQSHSIQANDLPPYAGSPIRGIHPQQIDHHSPPSRFAQATPQTGIFYNTNNTKYDPLTGLMFNTSTTNNNNENYEQSYVISSSLNQLTPRERQLPPPSSENMYSFHPQQNEQPILNAYRTETEESVVIPTLADDDGLPVVSVDKKHLPVYARFPFDVTFLPRPMDTNVEDNIHKLRLRLIDSELDHQRRSADEYLKRTPEPLSFLSHKPIHNARPPPELVYQRATSKILSRQPSYSRLSIGTPISVGDIARLSRDRIGMENDPPVNLDLERELEIRGIQESLNSGRRSNQQLMISNYSYDPRLHLQPVLEERQYSSSNMDDLIDSMARRHLAYRRLDVAIDRQRRGTGVYGSHYESSAVGRRASLRSQQRNDDLFFTNTPPRSHIERDFNRTHTNGFNQTLRSRIDYYNRIQPDPDNFGMDDTIRRNSYAKLPPISPGYDSHRLNRSQNLSTSALYQAKHSAQGHQQSLPLSLPNHSEHLIELPSDIFLSSRTEPVGSPRRHHRTRRTKSRSIAKDKSDISADSESDQSNGENDSSIATRQHSRNKKKQEKTSENDQHGFFTEGNPQQKKTKLHRQIFRKAAIGVYFLNVLKHRAAKSRLNRPSQTLSATIHKIRLQEIMVALHRVYLEPDGPIYNALIQASTSSVELKDALNTSSKNYSEAIHVIGEALKNVISRIVDFMPRDGILGTAKNSAVSALIQDGNPFPDNYFWQCERTLLEFNKTKMINVTKQRAILLLIGVFIFRALVTTLLIKPIKYRLMLGELTSAQTASLKVLASVMLYVGRRAAGSNSQILPLPHEWERSLYSDADIEPIVQDSEIKSIITTCELSLRIWCEEYIHRIDASFGKELRT